MTSVAGSLPSGAGAFVWSRRLRGAQGLGEDSLIEVEMTFLSDLERTQALSQNSAQLRLFPLLSCVPFLILKQFQTYKNVEKIVIVH